MKDVRIGARHIDQESTVEINISSHIGRTIGGFESTLRARPFQDLGVFLVGDLVPANQKRVAARAVYMAAVLPAQPLPMMMTFRVDMELEPNSPC